MIGNVYRGNGVRGLLDYLASKDGAVLLSTNLAGTTPRTFARQIGDVRRLHPKETLADPVCHIPLRPAPGEDLTDEQWQDALEFTLEAMGFDNSPYAAYIHDHGDGRHLHIATYRVTFEGRLVSDSFDRRRLMAVARELESRFGLTVAKREREVTLTRPELERLLRNPKREGQLEGLRRAVDHAASSRDTLRQFLTELHRLGVEPQLKISTNGNLQGISFRLPDGSVIKGSALGKRYSLASICNRHELRIDRKATGPVLTASEVTKAELELLRKLDLEPDLISRRGSRHTLYWALPPAHEEAFTDLIALQLPHRFLDFSEEPKVSWPQPPDLDGRIRKAQLLREVSAAPPGALTPVTLPMDLPRFGGQFRAFALLPA